MDPSRLCHLPFVIDVDEQMCVGDDLCYYENTAIKAFLNLPKIRELLGAETPYNFTPSSPEVFAAFNAHMDKYNTPTQFHVASLLDRGVRVLIYAGTYDWQCNWVSNKLWVDALEWSGSDEYRAAQWKDWTVQGRKAGEVKSTLLLTFATIRGAGHMMSTFSHSTLDLLLIPDASSARQA